MTLSKSHRGGLFTSSWKFPLGDWMWEELRCPEARSELVDTVQGLGEKACAKLESAAMDMSEAYIG